MFFVFCCVVLEVFSALFGVLGTGGLRVLAFVGEATVVVDGVRGRLDALLGLLTGD